MKLINVCIRVSQPLLGWEALTKSRILAVVVHLLLSIARTVNCLWPGKEHRAASSGVLQKRQNKDLCQRDSGCRDSSIHPSCCLSHSFQSTAQLPIHYLGLGYFAVMCSSLFNGGHELECWKQATHCTTVSVWTSGQFTLGQHICNFTAWLGAQP